MKNKRIQTVLGIALFTMVLFLSLTTSSSASGYGPYGPYGPHTPVDTSTISTDVFSIIGLGLYAVGSVLLLSASKLKKLIIN